MLEAYCVICAILYAWTILLLRDSGTSSITWYGLFRSKWTVVRGRMGPAVSGWVQVQILAGHLGENNSLTILSLFSFSASWKPNCWLFLLAADRQTCKTWHSLRCERWPKIHWGHHWSKNIFDKNQGISVHLTSEHSPSAQELDYRLKICRNTLPL